MGRHVLGPRPLDDGSSSNFCSESFGREDEDFDALSLGSWLIRETPGTLNKTVKPKFQNIEPVMNYDLSRIDISNYPPRDRSVQDRRGFLQRMLASSWSFESVRLIRLSGVIAERSIDDDRAGASRAVVVSTDCGADCDDQWAIAHLALIPLIDLKAIVTSHAPGLTPAAAAAKAREVLGALGLDKAPRVIEGASAPLARADSPRDTPGARTLIDEARGRSPRDRLTVVMIGAATDVASALLIDPSLAERIEVVAMGFESYPKGTDPWNVKNDVKAWRIVLESTVRLVVGDSVVSRRRLKMNPTEAKSVLPKDDPVSRMLIAELVRRLDEQPASAEKETGEKRTWPIWDEVTVAYLLGLTKTKTVPRLRLLDDLTFDQERSAGTIDWVTEIDRDALFRDLAHRIKINGDRKRK